MNNVILQRLTITITVTSLTLIGTQSNKDKCRTRLYLPTEVRTLLVKFL